MNTEEDAKQNLPRFRGHVVAALETENDALKDQLKQRDETIKELREDIDTLKRGILRGDELHAHMRFDDEPFTPYQLALQEIKQLKEALREVLPLAQDYVFESNLMVSDGPYKLQQEIGKKRQELIDNAKKLI